MYLFIYLAFLALGVILASFTKKKLKLPEATFNHLVLVSYNNTDPNVVEINQSNTTKVAEKWPGSTLII